MKVTRYRDLDKRAKDMFGDNLKELSKRLAVVEQELTTIKQLISEELQNAGQSGRALYSGERNREESGEGQIAESSKSERGNTKRSEERKETSKEVKKKVKGDLK